MNEFAVSTFYLFVTLPDCEQVAARLREHCEQAGVLGTVLLAEEGINGTLAGSAESIERTLAFLRADPRLAALTDKRSQTTRQPFQRLKIRIKPEIVKLGLPDIDPATMAGERVDAQTWNRLLDDPAVVVIDTRNDYEVAIGSFPGAINPATDSFGELPAWVEQQQALQSRPPVAMFCTGGIRCEKSTALLRAQGFDQVYHLDGGILKYLESVAPEQNRWQGECFVFDERVSVDKSLQTGTHRLCSGCGHPVPRDQAQCSACATPLAPLERDD